MSNTDNLDNVAGSSEPNSGPDESTALAVIEEQAEARVRRIWHEDRWYFSIIDIIWVLADTPAPRQFWALLKRRVVDEGFRETLTKCLRLKLPAADGKMRVTDAADVETLLRII